jgi:hypothetical protein
VGALRLGAFFFFLPELPVGGARREVTGAGFDGAR